MISFETDRFVRGAAPLRLAPASPRFGRPQLLGHLPESLRESSGLAVSRRAANVLWSHNDSGNRPALIAVTRQGKELAQITLNAQNVDWEDLASFTRDGVPYLVVADVGNNDAVDRDSALHVLPEPNPTGRSALRGVRTLRFRFEDGPRDCESLGITPDGNTAFLISKRDEVKGLYVLDLRGDAPMRTATRVADLTRFSKVPRPGHAPDSRAARWPDQPTAMDLSPDGREAAVLTYDRAYLFQRAEGESWVEAFQREPVHIDTPIVRQAEAIAFDRDGRSLLVTTEKKPRSLHRIPRLG